MKDVQRTGEPREGQAEFDKIDIRTYTQRVFSMYGGKKKRRVNAAAKGYEYMAQGLLWAKEKGAK